MDEVRPDKLKEQQAATIGLEQPIAVTIFGMFNIAVGGLMLFTSPCTICGIALSGKQYGEAVGYTIFVLLTYLAGLGLYVWLLSLGAGLIMMKKWARRGSVQCASIAILWWIFLKSVDILALWAGWVNPAEVDRAVFISRMCLSSIGLIHPVLLLIFMKTKKVKEAFSAIEG
jgi:hypothetical protein